MENWEQKFDEKFKYKLIDVQSNAFAHDTVKEFIREILPPAKPDKRNPEIQALWEYGMELGFTETKQNYQRFALKRLLTKFDPKKLRTAAKYTTTIKPDLLRRTYSLNNFHSLSFNFLRLLWVIFLMGADAILTFRKITIHTKYLITTRETFTLKF